jgi:hypothetical protein
MIRRFQDLGESSRQIADGVADGIFLVRIERVQCRWHAQKPYYLVRFSVLEPKQSAARSITGRIYCTPKALWKLSWFLRDFGYDVELLAHDEIEEKRLAGLTGVVKISHVVRNGSTLLNFDAFAPADKWHELSGTNLPPRSSSEVAS